MSHVGSVVTGGFPVKAPTPGTTERSIPERVLVDTPATREQSAPEMNAFVDEGP